MAEFLTRQQIKEKLSSLDRLTTKLFEEYGDNHEFFSRFAGLSEDIAVGVGPNEFEWAHEQIDAILERHGIDPNRDMSPVEG